MITHSESFVELVDHMGDDYRVLQAARVSTGSQARKGDEADKKLIMYLWKNMHQTPFEKLVFEFKVKTPIFVARQVFRHRMGSFNEASARYKEMDFEVFTPEVWRQQNTEGNKQGSAGAIRAQEQANFLMLLAYDQAAASYEQLLALGVAKELARVVLPVGLYTEFFWTINFRSLANFLALRLDAHAQPEIQDLAQRMAALVKPLIPWTYEAFETYGRGGE